MTIFATDGVGMTLRSALDGLSLRQRVIADNIANVNTPDFRAKQVDFEASLRSAVADGSVLDGSSRATVSATGGPEVARGNDVDLGAQTVAAMQAVFSYQLMSRAVTERYDLLRTAAGSF